MKEDSSGRVQVYYQTKKLYIVTIVLKYQKRDSNNNNEVLYILLLNIIVLSTETSWNLIQNEKTLVHGVINDWNGT